MATIGTFTANADGSFTGAINTLAINLKKVQFRPVAEKSSDKAPDFRITAGLADLGAAWKKTSKDNNAYLSVRLDDPSFGHAINAALVVIDDVHTLVWSRSTGPKED
ncbi:DUF736 domain-containing protein [Caulobacter endophyticus]|uniref:DUF736 domain-containing protein n=1 Tax=Caulobacter endophyticus TaxID=2172652 RepID=A0A2T9KA70_9CAUL|nr:DUF736 domain-containing protein [Caulobacter endophyticus]PVM92773.1 DUF736 domain-containing protein [Caulobacter endophyticus]